MPSPIATAFVAVRPSIVLQDWKSELENPTTGIPGAVKKVAAKYREVSLIPVLDKKLLQEQINLLQKGIEVPVTFVDVTPAGKKGSTLKAATTAAKNASAEVEKVTAATRKKVEKPLTVTVDAGSNSAFAESVRTVEARLLKITEKTHHVKIQVDLLGAATAEKTIAKLTSDIAALEAAAAKASADVAKAGAKTTGGRRGGAKETAPVDVTPKLVDGGKSLISEIGALKPEVYVKAILANSSIGEIQAELSRAAFTINVNANLTPEAAAAISAAEKAAATTPAKGAAKGARAAKATGPAVTPTVTDTEVRKSLVDQMKGLEPIPFPVIPLMNLVTAREALELQAAELGAIEVNIVGKVATVEETGGNQVDVPVSTKVSQEELNALATKIKEGTAAEIEVIAKLAPNTQATLQDQLNAITGLGVKVTGELTGTTQAAAAGAAGAATKTAGGGSGRAAAGSAARLASIEASVASAADAAGRKISNLAKAQDLLTKTTETARLAQAAFRVESGKNDKAAEARARTLRDEAVRLKEFAQLHVQLRSVQAPAVVQQKTVAAAGAQLDKVQTHLNEITKAAAAAAASGDAELERLGNAALTRATKAFDKAQDIKTKLEKAAPATSDVTEKTPVLTAAEKSAAAADDSVASLNKEINSAARGVSNLAGAEARLVQQSDVLTRAQARLRAEVRAGRADNVALLRGRIQELETARAITKAQAELHAVQQTPQRQVQTGLSAKAAGEQAKQAIAELEQAQRIAGTLTNPAQQAQAEAAARRRKSIADEATQEENAARKRDEALATTKKLKPVQDQLTTATRRYTSANVAAQAAISDRIALEKILRDIQRQRTSTAATGPAALARKFEAQGAAGASGLESTQKLITRMQNFEQFVSTNIAVLKAQEEVANIPSAAGKLEGAAAATKQLAQAEKSLTAANEANRVALELGDKALIKRTELLQQEAIAAINDLQALEKLAISQRVLDQNKRVAGQIAQVNEAGRGDTGVSLARQQLHAAINAEKFAVALQQVAIGTTELLPEQRLLIEETLKSATAMRVAKEEALANARTLEKLAVTRSQFNRGILATSASFLGLRGAVLASSAGFLAATIGLTLFSKLVSSSGELQQGLNTFQATVGATGEQMKAVSSLAQALGADIRLPATSANDAINAMTELAKAGLSVADAMAAARGTLQLAAAATIEAGDAAQITAGILNQYALAGAEASKITDILANASILAQGSIQDFAEGFRALGPTAHEAGLSVQQTAALLTELGRAGLAGAFGGTAIKTFLLRLVQDSGPAVKQMEELGITLDETRSIGEQLPSIITQYTAALAKLTPIARQEALNTIFGTRGIQAAGVIFNQGTANFLRFRAEVDKNGTAAELANARMKGLKGSVDALGSSTQTLATELGEFFLPALTSITREVTKMVNAIGSAVQVLEPFKGLITATTGGPIGGFAAQVGIIAALGAGLIKLKARYDKFFGPLKAASREAAASIAADQAAEAKAAIAVSEAIQFQARGFIGLEPVSAESSAVIIANERAKLAATLETNAALGRQSTLNKEAAGASILPGLFRRGKKPVPGAPGETPASPFGNFSGKAFGVGLAAQLIGDQVGGRFGGALSAGGQGAELGSFFGVQGAIAGAAGFAALDFISESQRKSKERRAKARDAFGKLDFDGQLQYFWDHFPDLRDKIDRIRQTSDSDAFADLLRSKLGDKGIGAQITVENALKSLGGFKTGGTPADTRNAQATLIQSVRGFAPQISPRTTTVRPSAPGRGVAPPRTVTTPQSVFDTNNFPFLVDPLATRQAARGAEAAEAVANGQVLPLKKATKAWDDLKFFLASFGISLDKAKDSQNKVKLEALLTSTAQEKMNAALQSAGIGGARTPEQFAKLAKSDEALIASLRADLTAPNKALNGWALSAKERLALAERITKIANRLADRYQQMLDAIDKQFEVARGEVSLAQTVAEGTKGLQDNLAADRKALQVEKDILKELQENGAKRVDILKQQQAVAAAQNAIVQDKQAIVDEATQAANDAAAAQEAGLRHAADAAGNTGKAEQALLAFLQDKVRKAKKNTTEYWDAVNALEAEQTKQKDAIDSLAASARSLVDARQQNRLAAAGLTDTKVDDRAALNAILGTAEKRLKIARALARRLQKEGKVGTADWYKAQSAIEELKAQIISTKQSIKSLSDSGGGGGGFGLKELFQEAVSNFNAFASNIAGRNGVLSPQDARGSFAKTILDIGAETSDAAKTAAQQIAEAADLVSKAVVSAANKISNAGTSKANVNPVPRHFATGGVTPGSGMGDTVPTMLTPGEVVFNNRQIKVIASKLGVPATPHSVFAAGNTQHFGLGGIVKSARKKLGSTWDWFADSEHDRNAHFAYELWRGREQFTPKWKGHRDEELFNYWLKNVASSKYKDVEYHGRNQRVGKGSPNVWKAWADAFRLTPAAKAAEAVITGHADGGVVAASNYSKMKNVRIVHDPNGNIRAVNAKGVTYRTFRPGSSGYDFLNPGGRDLPSDQRFSSEPVKKAKRSRFSRFVHYDLGDTAHDIGRGAKKLDAAQAAITGIHAKTVIKTYEDPFHKDFWKQLGGSGKSILSPKQQREQQAFADAVMSFHGIGGGLARTAAGSFSTRGALSRRGLAKGLYFGPPEAKRTAFGITPGKPKGPLPAQDLFSEIGRVEAQKMLDKLAATKPPVKVEKLPARTRSSVAQPFSGQARVGAAPSFLVGKQSAVRDQLADQFYFRGQNDIKGLGDPWQEIVSDAIHSLGRKISFPKGRSLSNKIELYSPDFQELLDSDAYGWLDTHLGTSLSPVSIGIVDPFKLSRHPQGKLFGATTSIAKSATVHEIGHALDASILKKTYSEFGTRSAMESLSRRFSHGEMPALMKQILASKEITDLGKAQLGGRGSGSLLHSWEGVLENPSQLNFPGMPYLLDPREMFARAFEQWAAWKTGDRDLVNHLGNSMELSNRLKREGDRSFQSFWPADQFGPISKAMDALFKSKGMLKKFARGGVIPFMAEGGIVSKPTLAMIGENGREAVIPLPKGPLFPGRNVLEAINHQQLSEAERHTALLERIAERLEPPGVALVERNSRAARGRSIGTASSLSYNGMVN